MAGVSTPEGQIISSDGTVFGSSLFPPPIEFSQFEGEEELTAALP